MLAREAFEGEPQRVLSFVGIIFEMIELKFWLSGECFISKTGWVDQFPKDLDVGQIDDTFAVGFHGGLEKRVFAQATVNLDVGKEVKAATVDLDPSSRATSHASSRVGTMSM